MLPVLISASSSIQKERITKSLSYDFVRYANISDNLDLEDKFSACSSVPVFLDVSSVDHQIRSNKMHERLEKIMGATDGYIGGLVCDFFPILITVGKIPKYLKSRVMVVPLELNRVFELDVGKVTKDPEYFKLIKSRVIEDAACAETDPALLAAAYFVHPNPETGEELEELSQLKDAALKITQYGACYASPDGIAEMFIEELLSRLNGDEVFRGYELPNLKADAVANLNDAFFFNKGFVYISLQLLEKMAGNLVKSVGIDALKEALEEAGILVGEKGAMSSRMYYRVEGVNRNVRMLRLDITSLEPAEGATVFDLVMKKEEGSDE